MTNHSINCPFCAQAGLPADTTRNLHVRTDGVYHCFRCGAKPKTHGVLHNITQLAGMYAAGIQQQPATQNTPTRVHTIKDCWHCHSYFNLRNLNPDALPQQDTRVYGGWVRGHRIIFERGGWWQGRATSPRNPIRYLFPRDTGQPKPLFHMDPTRGRSKTVCVVEGPFDALRLYQEGFRTVALCGKSFSTAKLAQLQELAPKRIVWCLDKDVSYLEFSKWIISSQAFARDRLWELQDGADPAEASARDLHELRKIVRGKW